MSIRVLRHPSLDAVFALAGVELTALIRDFTQYKASGVPPSNFGRDAVYNHANTLPSVRQQMISHVHIEEPGHAWDARTTQFNKTSDTHLVYCRGFNDQNCYLLMALLTPNAHDQALNRTIMFNLGQMASIFRSKY